MGTTHATFGTGWFISVVRCVDATPRITVYPCVRGKTYAALSWLMANGLAFALHRAVRQRPLSRSGHFTVFGAHAPELPAGGAGLSSSAVAQQMRFRGGLPQSGSPSGSASTCSVGWTGLKQYVV